MIKKQNKNYTAEEKNVQRLKLWLELYPRKKMAALRKLKTITNLLIFSSYTFKVMFSVFYQFFVSSVFTGL